MAKKAKVMYDGVLAAILTETDEGYTLAYDAHYLKQANSRPVSFTLPMQRDVYSSKTLFAFFDGLIPEGWLLDIAIAHWKIKANDRFELLLAMCRYTIGAVTILPENDVE